MRVIGMDVSQTKDILFTVGGIGISVLLCGILIFVIVKLLRKK